MMIRKKRGARPIAKAQLRHGLRNNYRTSVEFRGGDSAVLVERIPSNARRSVKESDARTGLLCHL